MKNTLIFSLMIVSLFLFTGCFDSGTDSLPDPTSVGEYFISGQILTEDGTPTQINTVFKWSSNPSKSFATDSNGMYTFVHPGTDYYGSFMNFSSSALTFSVSWNFTGAPTFEAPYIYVINSKPFSIDSLLTKTQRHELVVLAGYIEKNDLDTAENQVDNLITGTDTTSEYSKYLRILQDFILLKQDFSNLSSLVTEEYFSRLCITQDMYTSRQYYGGLLYVMKILLSDDRSSNSQYFSDCITFLEKINADNISFTDNNAKFLGLLSDDIKALLLLAYVFEEDQIGIEKFSAFTPDDSSSFGYQIKELLDNIGYLSREKSN